MIANKKTYNIKCPRLKYYASFLLIYPFFFARKKEKFLLEKLQRLAKYKTKLISLVVEKQEILKSVYVKHKSTDFDKIDSLFVSCAYVKINQNNFAHVNAQMDQINSLITLKKSYEKIKKSFGSKIWPYTDEIKMISQYYYSILGLIEYKYKSFPWKYLLTINKFNEFEITI